MKLALFSLVIMSLVVSNAFLWFSILWPKLRLWPPPETDAPQYRLSLLTRALSPITVVGVFAIGPMDFGSLSIAPAVQIIPGLLLFVIGGAFALWGYFGLGVQASQGQYEGLVVSGAYRYSRNPQYVGTVVCVFGYGLATASVQVLVAWTLWTLWFLGAPFAEEPWMRNWLGESYDEYAAQVPRFIGLNRSSAHPA